MRNTTLNKKFKDIHDKELLVEILLRAYYDISLQSSLNEGMEYIKIIEKTNNKLGKVQEEYSNRTDDLFKFMTLLTNKIQ